jgi:hypothetical protein
LICRGIHSSIPTPTDTRQAPAEPAPEDARRLQLGQSIVSSARPGAPQAVPRGCGPFRSPAAANSVQPLAPKGRAEQFPLGSRGAASLRQPANHFVAQFLADLPHLIAGGIVGSMPLSRTQQQTADLFQAAGAQESCRAHTPAGLTSAQQSAAVVSGAEKLSSRHVLPRDLSNALKQLDDGELDRLYAATRHELQRRGRLLTSTPAIRPTRMGTEQRASDQSTTTEESPERRQREEPNVALTPGQVNAVRATFKAGITPTRIARQFGISQSDVRKVLASESRRSGKRR